MLCISSIPFRLFWVKIMYTVFLNVFSIWLLSRVIIVRHKSLVGRQGHTSSASVAFRTTLSLRPWIDLQSPLPRATERMPNANAEQFESNGNSSLRFFWLFFISGSNITSLSNPYFPIFLPLLFTILDPKRNCLWGCVRPLVHLFHSRRLVSWSVIAFSRHREMSVGNLLALILLFQFLSLIL